MAVSLLKGVSKIIPEQPCGRKRRGVIQNWVWPLPATARAQPRVAISANCPDKPLLKERPTPKKNDVASTLLQLLRKCWG